MCNDVSTIYTASRFGCVTVNKYDHVFLSVSSNSAIVSGQ